MTKLTAIIDRIFDQHFIYKKSIKKEKGKSRRTSIGKKFIKLYIRWKNELGFNIYTFFFSIIIG